MKKHYLIACVFMFIAFYTTAQTARIQAIHNSADIATANVDVWLTTPTGSSLLLDDFQFRNASPFIDAPADVPITISFAPSTSTSITDIIPGLSFPFTLTSNETYILVAEGIISATGYSPANPFDIAVYAMGREAAITGGQVDVLVHHGSTDAGTVDVRTQDLLNLLADDISYGDFEGYLALGDLDYEISITDASGSNVVASYSAPLNSLGLVDSAITIVA